MSHTTQCPSCQTKFKVSDAHLALAGGMVRCGRCSHVFHAPSHFDSQADVALTPPPAPQAAPAPAPAPSPRPPEDDDFELELPDFEPAPAANPAPQAAVTSAQANRFDDILPDTPLPETDFDLPDFDLMERQLEAERQAATQPPAQAASQPIVPDFRAAAAQAEAEAGNKEMDAFQQALAEALRTPATSGSQRKLSAYVQAEPAEEDTDEAAERDDTPPPASQTRQEAAFSAPAFDEPVPASREQISATLADEEQDAAAPARGNVVKTTLFTLLAAVLLLVLLGQVLFINRTRVSAEAPELRPAFESLCASLGCSVPLPTDRQLIRTEWSELSFVPQNDHLIQLNATLKNLAKYPQAFPVMELTLKDAEDKVVVRKAFRPEEYVPASDFKLGQFNSNSELKLQVRMSMSQGKALGYSLHFYYP